MSPRPVFFQSARDGHQAVSVIIGVMLIMSIAFLAAAQYQVNIVPQQEETTEITHYRTVSTQMSELRSHILTASAIDAANSQKLSMGVEYSQDLIFGIIPEIHGTDPAGTIENKEFTGQIEVRNVEGLGSASSYWPGVSSACETPSHCFDTTSLHYGVEYAQFSDSPEIIYENTVVYDKYENSQSTASDDEYSIHSDQTLIKGRTLNLVALTGSLQQSRVSPATVEAVPVSAPAQPISVTSNGSDPVTVVVPTRLPVTVWETRILDGQIRGPDNTNGYVNAIRAGPSPNTVEIEMVPSQTYTLKLSRVHLSSRQEASATPVSKAAYVGWQGNERTTLRENTTNEISAQVRDRYNNPVAGIDTNARARDGNNDCIGGFPQTATSTCSGGQNQPGEATSGENGALTYFYDAPDVDADTTISLDITLDDPENTYTPQLAQPDPQPVRPLATTTRRSDPPTLLAESHTDASARLSPTPARTYRAAPRLGGTDFPTRPSIRAGYLNSPENTVRVVDFELQQERTTYGQTVASSVLVDNTGHQTHTVTLSPTTSTRPITTTPAQYEITLDPGERKRVGFDIQFREAGTYTLTMNGEAGRIYHVDDARDDSLLGVIRNRVEKETIQKSPSVFKDGDSVDEFRESPDIPPVEYDPTVGRYEDSAAGNLFDFPSLGPDDAQHTTVKATPATDGLNVGFSTGYVARNEVYTLFVNYSFATPPSDPVRLALVDSTSQKTDPASQYYLSHPGDDSTTQRAFQLTRQETRTLQQSNELLSVISRQQGATEVELRIDSLTLESTASIPDLTAADIAVVPDSTTATPTTVGPSDRISLTVALSNTGNTVDTSQLKLYEDDGDGYTAVKSADVSVNPSDTKTTTVTLYRTDPGTYTYRFGTGTTPQSDPVTVTVTNT